MRDAVVPQEVQHPLERGRRDVICQHEHGSRRIDRHYALGLEHQPILEKLQALDGAWYATTDDARPGAFVTENVRRRREEWSCSEQFLSDRCVGRVARATVLPMRPQQTGNDVRFPPRRDGQRNCRTIVRERRMFDENPRRTICRDLRDQFVQLYGVRGNDLHPHGRRRARARELCGVSRQDGIATHAVKARFMRRQYDRDGIHRHAFAPDASDPQETQ